MPQDVPGPDEPALGRRSGETDPLPVQLAALRERIEALEQFQQAESAGFWGFVHRWGAPAALFAATVSTLVGAIQIQQTWDASNPEARVTLHPSLSSVSVHSFTDSSFLTITFPLAVENDGTDEEVVRTASASLRRLASSAPPLHFAATAISFRKADDDAPMALPLALGAKSVTALSVTLKARLTPESRRFFQQTGRWEVNIQLIGRTGERYRSAYCFELSQDLVDVFFEPSFQPLDFLHPECAAGEAS